METIEGYQTCTSDVLGYGSFAMVFRAVSKTDPNDVIAIKRILKKNLTKSMNLLEKEIKILKEVKHENVVTLYDCKEKPDCFLLFLELCNLGDLSEYIGEKKKLSEDTIRHFLRQLANAMKYLYSKGIVHRDLKPQNILLNHKSGSRLAPPHEIIVKIADFGFARVLNEGTMAKTLCGSPMYMAPEVIMSCHYDHKADLWSMGTILYQCLTGEAPFHANTPHLLKIKYEKETKLAPKIPMGTSPELSNLLFRLLKKDPKERLNFEEFFCHPFLSKGSRISSPVPVPSFRSGSNSPSSSCSPRSPREMRSSTPKVLTPPAPFTPFKNTSTLTEDLFAEEQSYRTDSQRLTDSEDFVMVPSMINDEAFTEIAPIPTRLPFKAIENKNQYPRQGTADLSPKFSHPIPVPQSPSSPKNIEGKSSPLTISRPDSTGRLTPDIANMSPPNVQFSIGTPPLNMGRRRSQSGGSPWRQSPLMFRNSSSGSLSSSPLRRSGLPSSPNMVNYLANNPLTPILASPGAEEWINSDYHYRRMGLGGNHTERWSPGGRESVLQRSGSMGQVMESNWSDPSSPRTPRARFFSESSNIPPLFPFGASPPNSDGTMLYIPPELPEETLLEREHVETLTKLYFVLHLVECIMDLAKSKSSPIMALSQSYIQKEVHMDVVSEGYRRAEQLVLYMRALNFLTQSIQLSQQEVKARRLKPSAKVKAVLKAMRLHFNNCLQVCKSLHSSNILQASGVDPASSNITADKLIYTHAIEMCQLAAMDELFGNPKECFRRYQTAHILFHSLGFQVIVQEDKAVLNKYKCAVEQRLFELSNQGYIHAYNTP